MNTILLDARDPQTPAVAAELIRRGRLVAIPTETVYGLGADGLNPEAVAKIFEAKGRPGDNPLILHVTGPEQLPLFCHHIPDVAYLLAERFWPGPLTMVLPANACVPRKTTGGLSLSQDRCHPGNHTAGRCSHRRPLSQSLRQALHHHSPARAPRPQRAH